MRAVSRHKIERPAPLRCRVLVVLLEKVHLQDMAGPVQVLYEADALGGAYALHYVGPTSRVRSAQGLTLGDLEPLPPAGKGDLILVPGVASDSLGHFDRTTRVWLRKSHMAGARVASVCSGAFVLGSAGLLDERTCTTHWKLTEKLRGAYPAARVVENRLYVDDGGVVTSAGVASGIDMALALVERDHGPLVVARVAREMVVYLRRSGEQVQQSIYLDHRTHLHPGVHRVQDFLVRHPERKTTLGELARVAAMSPRNLCRAFRQATTLTPKQFGTKVKLQVARDLVADPGRSIEEIASSCGFDDGRQLRRLWRANFGASISELAARTSAEGSRS